MTRRPVGHDHSRACTPARRQKPPDRIPEDGQPPTAGRPSWSRVLSPAAGAQTPCPKEVWWLAWGLRLAIAGAGREDAPLLTVTKKHEEMPAAGASGLLLDELARDGARRMLAAASKSEVAAYIEAHADQVVQVGRRVVVRNGRA